LLVTFLLLNWWLSWTHSDCHTAVNSLRWSDYTSFPFHPLLLHLHGHDHHLYPIIRINNHCHHTSWQQTISISLTIHRHSTWSSCGFRKHIGWSIALKTSIPKSSLVLEFLFHFTPYSCIFIAMVITCHRSSSTITITTPLTIHHRHLSPYYSPPTFLA
jgi:hypothetical protein